MNGMGSPYSNAPQWQQPQSMWQGFASQYQSPQMPSLSNMADWGVNKQAIQGLGQGAFGSNAVSDFDFAGGAFDAAGALDVAGGGKGKGLGFMDYILGGKAADGSQTLGMASPLIGLGKGIMDGYLGMQQLKLGKESMKFQKDAFSKQFDEQMRLNNQRRGDIERARASSRG